MFTRRPSPDTRELLGGQLAQPRRSVHEAYRRPFGAQPPAFLGALSLVALILALMLLIIGAWISATIALGVFIALTTLLIPAVRHDPHSQAARITRRSVNGATRVARFVYVVTRAWARAAVSLLHITQRRLRIKRELHSQLTPLGEAVHRGDQARVQQLKAQAEKLERQLNEIDRNASAIVEGARDAVDREKASSQPTQSLPATNTGIEIRGGEPQHAPDAQPVPTRRRRRPSSAAAGAVERSSRGN